MKCLVDRVLQLGWRSAAGALAALVHLQPAHAQCLSQTVVSSTPADWADFGFSGAIDGDRFACGSPWDDAGSGSDHGSVDVFRRNGTTDSWLFDGRLLAPSPLGLTQFGYDVDIDGNFALVGEPSRNVSGILDVGRAYLYVRNSNGWQHTATIEPPTAGWSNIAESRFGSAVALDGDFALIGMPHGPVNASNKPGKAYLYQRTFGNSAWELRDVFDAPSLSDELDFGMSLAMQHGVTTGDTFAVIGNPHHSTPLLDECGEVRMYKRPTSGTDWGNGQPLVPLDPQAGARFGASVSLSGGTLIVGAPDFDFNGVQNVGAAYVFTRTSPTTWTQQARIDSPLQWQGVSFGSSVSIEGDRMAIGGAGRAFIYQRTDGTWRFLWVIYGETTDFGTSAFGFSGDTVMVGSPATMHNGLLHAGKAFTYRLNDANGSNFCADAPYIQVGWHTGCTSAATRDARSTCDWSSGGSDVWYRWIAPCDGVASIDTDLSDFNTLLSVHTDCPTPEQTHQVACHQSPSSNYANVVFDAQAGQTYLIRIAGAASGVSGNYILNVDMTCEPPCDTDIAPAPQGDGVVNVGDLLMVITTWGVAQGAGDVNGDALVNVSDLLAVITSWGACP